MVWIYNVKVLNINDSGNKFTAVVFKLCKTLGSVNLCGLKFVQTRGDLITARDF